MEFTAPWASMDPSFTFSESELVDVLTFVSGMDDTGGGAAGGVEGVALPRAASRAQLAGIGTPTRPGLQLAGSLQFQPHQRGDVSGAGAAAAPAGLQFHPHLRGAAAFGDDRFPEGAGLDGLPKVSHGASEKQRRDRINSMIDQLRAIVPGDMGKGGKAHAADAGSEARRSKYVVLQQTINTLKSLQLRCAAQEDELGRLRSAHTAAAGAAANQASPASPPAPAAADSQQPGADLPSVPANAPPGVEVHPGPEAGTCYVRVACADRRGLLADILNALRAMPVEVVRAAITTSSEGFVNDVFELRCAHDAGGAALKNDDIKRVVERQLLAAAAASGAEDTKRRKVSARAAAAAAARDAP